MEFNEKFTGIGLVCMDSTQVIIQYVVNNPENILSSYLQPSYFNGTTYAQAGSSGAINPADPTSAYSTTNRKFLNACLLPDGMKVVLTDVVLRIPYYTYNDETAYSLVR